MAYESYCAACTYLSESGNGKYWCERKGEDRYATDSKCYSFCEAYSRSNGTRSNMIDNSKEHQNSPGCYLTTITCNILGYPDNNYYLNTLRDFRDNVMKKDFKYFPLLLTYDTIGPMIAYELSKDKNKLQIASTMFSHYITKSVDAIEEGKNNTAINIYKAMTEELAKRYNINAAIVMPNVEDINMSSLGHARVKKISN